ncbi:MAG: DNA translocase FtsK [Tenericutes bacterium]|nr:DNA translocase FtsK [Mycoplasmatota bacterium]
MAKKKQTSEVKESFPYTKELEGLGLILVGVLGFGKFGPIGRIIKSFGVFLFGTWWWLFLLMCLLIGIILIIKRKSPTYITGRLVGIYILVVSLLMLSHIKYISANEVSGVNIIKDTINNIVSTFDNPEMLIYTGGGIIGALLAFLFVSLFDITGTYIVVGIFVIFGLIMSFNITLSDIFNVILKPFKKKKKTLAEMAKEGEEELISRENNEIDDKVVITNINEITTKEAPMTHIEEVSYTEDKVKENADYVLPPLDLLVGSKNRGKIDSTEFITKNNKILEQVFNDFGIVGKVKEVHVGPTVTQYEIELKAGTKVNKILSINREIALALAAKDVRIQAPIPGKSTIGIEIPNPKTSEVKMKDILAGIPKKLDSSKLLAPLGLDIMGNIQYFEINKAPHMLIAGATGSGKSVCINNIITSILMRAKPNEVKMILVDPKKVELNCYEGVPHLMRPVVTDPKKASVALQKVCSIMEDRYEMFANSGTRNITSYNEYVEKNKSRKPELEKLPYILVIIDELADLMMVASKEVEESIMRITQLARAAGIHLIVATQRPSTDVITGLIKSNIPTRISFMVSSFVDSRTILDMGGAEKLLGKGDMLFLPPGEPSPIRIQGSFVSDEEIERVVEFVRRSGEPKYDESMVNLEKSPDEEKKELEGASKMDDDDPLYNEIVEFAVRTGKISASLIQRKYRLGYNRAARIIDLLEERGIIGPQNGSKPREVLFKMGASKEGGEEE